MSPPQWESINAITLAAVSMKDSVKFYQDLGLVLTFGGATEPFSTLGKGGTDNTFHVNLFTPESDSPNCKTWGRVIIYVADVDAMYALATSKGYTAEFQPRDAPWGERYFHIRDPSGHEVSFAKKIEGHPFWSRSTKSDSKV